MLVYALARLGQACVVLACISFIGFLLVANLGDPLATLLPFDATQAQRDELIRALHLDATPLERYFAFLADLAQGRFGLSYRTHEPVGAIIAARFPATAELALVSFCLTLAVGVPVGIYCGVRPRALLARLLMLGSIAGVTLPTFVVGILLILVFSVRLRWLPSFGRGEVVTLGRFWTTGFLTASGLKAFVLPALTLSLFQAAFVMRIIRGQLLEIARSDYIRFAVARGIAPRAIWSVHALKNALIPVVTVMGLQLGNILAFSVVTESVFAWPGLGLLFLQSIQAADIPVISVYLILIGLIFIVINVAVELTYPVIDARVLRGAR